MFCTKVIDILARKEHSCTWCAEKILKGELYKQWKSVDDSWFTNKMHEECYKVACDEMQYYSDWEYMPYSEQRPEKEIQNA